MQLRTASNALVFLILATGSFAQSQETNRDTSRGDAMIATYFKAETKRLTERSLSEFKTRSDWESNRDVERLHLMEMLEGYIG